MKAFVRWLSDPYVHVLSIAAILIWLSMGVGSIESAAHVEAEAELVCASCLSDHDASSVCPLLASGISPPSSSD
jgi:hypothetical protein